ncbi:hypothetical protein [Komagataeibacter saccharivorans]
MPGVCDLHDLHIWPLSTTETALTVHLVRAATETGQATDGHSEPGRARTA